MTNFHQTEKQIIDKILLALTQIQSNKIFINAHENTINDGLRDRLSMIFDCLDQSRRGVSENEIDSGEVDILIKNNGLPFALIESIRVTNIDSTRTKKHIRKALVNYDFNGCKVNCLVIYAMMERFGSYWEKVSKLLLNFDYPYSVTKPFENIETNLAECKHGVVYLDRQGTQVCFHIFAIHLK